MAGRDLIAYWRSLGDRVGAEVAPIRPPEMFQGLETRAVRIRPDVVLNCQPVDLNAIVLELPSIWPRRTDTLRDVMVGTNIFEPYYDAFERSLALKNAGAMLKSGGPLLTNDRLPGGSRRVNAAGWADRRANTITTPWVGIESDSKVPVTHQLAAKR